MKTRGGVAVGMQPTVTSWTSLAGSPPRSTQGVRFQGGRDEETKPIR